MTVLLTRLSQGLNQLNLSLDNEQIEKLHELLVQLLKWNKAYNLTAISDEYEALKLHLLDSLAVVPYWHFATTLDVGTGPGFPGLPLAIAKPDLEFHLLDSNSKKIRFIRQQVHSLGLNNVEAHHCRVEDHQSTGYQAIVSRAFASLKDMVTLSEHLLAEDGRWMAMKGVYDQAETAALPSQVLIESVNPLSVPGLNAERCLITLKRSNH